MNVNTIPIQLPTDRVRDAAVFEIVGIDLAGPLYVKTGEKVWIALFTCAVYRVVHLEVVSSLSTEAFIQSLRRFIARRGRPKTIFSDNGTNFVGTENALRKLDWNEIQDKEAVQKIDWKFNPPTASWWGGWFERLIRLIKDLLKKVLGKSHLSLEELVTILCECESVINSRPLTYISEDITDLLTLTPKMFLQEIIESGSPDLNDIEAKDLRRRYLYRLKLKENLKARFRSEYLGQLKLFSTKKKTSFELNVDDVVLLINDNQKKTDWILGKIIRLIHGRDGNVRVVEIKTASGNVLRPVQRICPLEIEKDTFHVQAKASNGKEDSDPDFIRMCIMKDDERSSYNDVNNCDDVKKKATTTRSGRISKPPEKYTNMLSH